MTVFEHYGTQFLSFLPPGKSLEGYCTGRRGTEITKLLLSPAISSTGKDLGGREDVTLLDRVDVTLRTLLDVHRVSPRVRLTDDRPRTDSFKALPSQAVGARRHFWPQESNTKKTRNDWEKFSDERKE